MSARKRPSASSLSADEWDRALQIGAFRYINSRRYKFLREKHVYAALDGVVTALEQLKFPNPVDARILGGCATVMLVHDDKVLGYLRKHQVGALDIPEDRPELFRLMGLLVADDYRRDRKATDPADPLFTDPRRVLTVLEDLFDDMAKAGQEMRSESVLANEMSVRFRDLQDPANIAEALIEDAIGAYEALLPSTEGEGVPNRVERRAIAKAAFLRLGVEDLEEQAASDRLSGELPTKDAMAAALAEKYAGDLDAVAKIVLDRSEGNPDVAYVTRLVPLKEPPVLDDVQQALEALRGHYLEARTAAFFIFGDVVRSAGVLTATGRVRSFTVNPAEAGGKPQLNFRPFNDEIQVRLRDDQIWAEIDARRITDLGMMRAVLRRTGVVTPAAAVPVPDRLITAPYDAWDPRTLWILDFLRTELRQKEVELDNTLMAHFVAPQRATEEGAMDAADAGRVAQVEAVRFFGTQLHKHPEACALIVGHARLRDLDVRVWHTYDLRVGARRLVRFRLAWENDHLAVLTGTVDEQLDLAFHELIVRLVRRAAPRQIDEAGMKFTLAQIARLAEEGEAADEGGRFFDEAAEG